MFPASNNEDIDEVLTVYCELCLGMTRSDAHGKVEAMSQPLKDKFDTITRQIVIEGV
jgi:hypothetical protein